MFDYVIFADWPRGAYLAQKLSEQGKKLAYMEIFPKPFSPWGIFLDKDSLEEKTFLESLGFLSRQEGGFCLVSPEGVWPFQDMKDMEDRLAVFKQAQQKNLSKDSFKDYWLSYLSLNLAGKVFEYNNSQFSDKGLNFFSDYFLFSSDFKKRKTFEENNPLISFYQVNKKDIIFKEKTAEFFIQGKLLESHKTVWLTDLSPLFKTQKTPEWEWTSCFFSVDLKDYEEIIPPHFVFLKNLFLPWGYDNLLSIFQKSGQWELWFRKPWGQSIQPFKVAIQRNLEAFFENCVFSSLNKTPQKGPVVYGSESLTENIKGLEDKIYVEDPEDFFQNDFASGFYAEKEFLARM